MLALTLQFPLQLMPCTPTVPYSWRAAPREAPRFWMPLPRPLRPQDSRGQDGG